MINSPDPPSNGKSAKGKKRRKPFAVLTQTVSWIPAEKEAPAALCTVLVVGTGPPWNNGAFIGYHDGQKWRSLTGLPIAVAYWAYFPKPPTLIP